MELLKRMGLAVGVGAGLFPGFGRNRFVLLGSLMKAISNQARGIGKQVFFFYAKRGKRGKGCKLSVRHSFAVTRLGRKWEEAGALYTRLAKACILTEQLEQQHQLLTGIWKASYEDLTSTHNGIGALGLNWITSPTPSRPPRPHCEVRNACPAGRPMAKYYLSCFCFVGHLPVLFHCMPEDQASQGKYSFAAAEKDGGRWDEGI